MKKSSAETEDWNSQTSNSCLPPFLNPYWDLHLSDLSQPYAAELAQKHQLLFLGALFLVLLILRNFLWHHLKAFHCCT